MQRIAALTAFGAMRTTRSAPSATAVRTARRDAPSNLRVTYRPEVRSALAVRGTRAARHRACGGTRTCCRWPARDAISLGEGGTALVDAPRMARRLGLDRLFIKDETRNPTWSYKDRLSTVAVSRAPSARRAGAGHIVVRQCRRLARRLRGAGRPAVRGAHHRRHRRSRCWRRSANMARPSCRSPTRLDRWPMLAEGVRRYGWFATSPYAAPVVGSHPIGIEGYKTLAYRDRRAAGRHAPRIGAPCRSATATPSPGCGRAFSTSREMGAIDRLPRLIAAEAHGSLAAALRDGGDRIPNKPATFQTLAISIGATQSAYPGPAGAAAVERTCGRSRQ